MYQMAKFKIRGYKVIPEDLAKTSQPQTWHRPRGEQIRGTNIQNMEVVGYTGKSASTSTSQSTRTVQTTFYNPLRSNVPPFSLLHEKLSAVAPDVLILPAISTENASQCPVVNSRVGQVPKGSVLSYHQQLSPAYIFNIHDGVPFPKLPVIDNMVNNYSRVLTLEQSLAMEDVFLEISLVHSFEDLTRDQSESSLWHKLRLNRVTASKVGEIFKRRQDFDTLAVRLKTKRHVCTAAMKHGIVSEPVAAARYSEARNNEINLYPSGIVISPTSPWIAASPDRKVYDPTRNPPFGLLEVKCVSAPSVVGADCLKKSANNELSLKRRHNYYYQVLTQLAVTGLEWCDFFVWCENDHHMETIHFDQTEWQDVKDKLDIFFFQNFLVLNPPCNMPSGKQCVSQPTTSTGSC